MATTSRVRRYSTSSAPFMGVSAQLHGVNVHWGAGSERLPGAAATGTGPAVPRAKKVCHSEKVRARLRQKGLTARQIDLGGTAAHPDRVD